MISSHPDWPDYRTAPIRGHFLKRWLKSRFRYVDYPFLLSHRGFGNREHLVLQGHIFRGMALSRPGKKSTVWRNFINLLKMYSVRTVPQGEVELLLEGRRWSTRADEQGFFEFELPDHNLATGWYEGRLRLTENLVDGQEDVSVAAELRIDDQFEYGCISDIDDTFLVSHVTRFWRKFYLLLTKDPATRKPFQGVVDFYRMLNRGVTSEPNPFFYVSSSEWNLYEFLLRFMKFHRLPKGVLQLRDIKEGLWDFLDGSHRDHDHKRHKIERILHLHPGRSFILLGDNGQHDPAIYAQVAQGFPKQVKAVYIRAVKHSNHKKAEKVIRSIRELGIPVLQFHRSKEAIEHARQQGFIVEAPPAG